MDIIIFCVVCYFIYHKMRFKIYVLYISQFKIFNNLERTIFKSEFVLLSENQYQACFQGHPVVTCANPLEKKTEGKQQ